MNDAASTETRARNNAPDRLYLAGIGLLAFALRVLRIDYQSLWRDEVDAVLFASRSLGEALAMFTRVGENGPLYFLGLHGWIGLAGTSEFALRFPSACCGVLAVLLTYRLGRVLLGRAIAFIATLLLAVSPYHVWYSQEAKMYALISFLAPLSLYVLWRAVDSGRRRLWLAWAALMVAFLYIHLFAAMMLLVSVIWLPLLRPSRRWRLSPALAIAVVAVAAAALPLVRWLVPAALTAGETGYTRYGLGEMVAILLRNFSMGLRPASGAWPVLFFLLPLVLGAAPLVIRRRPALPGLPWPSARAVLLTLVYLAAPLLAIWLISLRRPTFTDRYLIISLPGFFLLAATGIVVVAHLVHTALHTRAAAPAAPAPRRRRVAAARAGMYYTQARAAVSPASAAGQTARSPQWLATGTVALLLVSMAPFTWAQTHNPYKADFRAAAAYISARAAADDLILFVMPYVQRGFAYYHPQPMRTAEPPFTRDMSAAQVDAAMRAIVGGSRMVWLFLSEAEFWDERGKVAAWMEANAVRRCQQEFAYIEVRCYDVR